MRERLRMDPQWRFHLGDFPMPKGNVQWAKGANFLGEPLDPDYDDSGWRLLDLPHDFVTEAAPVRTDEAVREALFFPGDSEPRSYHMMHGFLRAGIGWYRKSFFIPNSDEGRRLWLEMDGVFRNSTTWLNRHYLGNHLSGYTGVRYDITDLLHYGGWNTVVVRVDATEFESWSYEGGGIYRHVWLVKTGPLAIAPDGLFVACELNASQAIIRVQTAIQNALETTGTGKLMLEIHDPNGRPVSQTALDFSVNRTRDLALTLPIAAPILWSPESPARYTLTASIETAGNVVDQVAVRFGVRSAQFDPDRGFLLNGQPVKLKGVCCHQDHAGMGVALPDRLQEFRIEQLQAMGCNAYRCAHHPPAPELLEICDRLGMLVMVENRILSTAPAVLQQLEAMVKLGRNHPCVILWSLANEENQLQGTAMGARILATMRKHVRQFDDTRPVTLAMNGNWPGPATAVVDVQGCNYIASGDVDEFHRRHPRTPIVYTEADGSMGTRGEYADDPARGVISGRDTRQAPDGQLLTEANWVHCLERPFVAGTFIWTGFAYRGEPAPTFAWPVTGAHFGALDDCGFPKDGFFYYQSIWSAAPVLHLSPHWNWPGRSGQPVDVWVYTNLDAVELFLNGVSLGRQSARSARHLEWTVPYAPGTLVGRGYRSGQMELETRVETTGPIAALRLAPDREKIRADGEDLVIVRVAGVDAQGRVVPDAGNLVVIEVRGGGRLVGTGNGNPANRESDKENVRTLFHGLAMAIVQAGVTAGEIQITARAPGLLPAECIVAALPATPRPFVPAGGPPVIGRVECSALCPPVEDIRTASAPGAGRGYEPVHTLTPYGLYDIRSFHSDRDGLLYLRVSVEAGQPANGSVWFGADGPVKVWVNGREVACQPEATNPARQRDYRARAAWETGANEVIFALATNHGKAWGVYVELTAH